MKERRKQEYLEKTPGDEFQKMPHTTVQRFMSQARLEPAQQHWWLARKADVLTVTPRVWMTCCAPLSSAQKLDIPSDVEEEGGGGGGRNRRKSGRRYCDVEQKDSNARPHHPSVARKFWSTYKALLPSLQRPESPSY